MRTNPFKETELKIRIEIDTTEPAPPDLSELVSEVLESAAHGLDEARNDHMLTGFLDVADDAGMSVGPIEVSGDYEYQRPSWDDPFKLKYSVEITL
jgi:hypothetical protein